MRKIAIVLMGLVAFMLITDTVHAAPAGLLRKAVTEIVEGVLKKGGATAARELAEFGGEQAVKEIAEQTWRAGGEAAVRRLTHYATAHGAAALRAVRTHPAQVLRALDQIPTSQVNRAIAAINHHPTTMSRLISNYGADALQVSLRHPGVGMDLAQILGREGINTALRLQTPHVIQLSRHAHQLAKVEPAARRTILDMISKAPANVLAFLEKHPRVLLTGAAVATLIHYREPIMGGDELIIHDDGRIEVVSKPGMLERTAEKTLNTAAITQAALIVAFLVGLGLFFRIIRPLIQDWRLGRQQRRAEAAKVAAEARNENSA